MTTNTRVSAAPKRSLNWRVVDIVVASVLGVACGFVFLGWNAVGYAWFEAMDAVTPGLGVSLRVFGLSVACLVA